MSNCSLHEDNISFIKSNNQKNQEIPYLVHSTWHMHATEGKWVFIKEFQGMRKAKWDQNKRMTDLT